MTVRVGLIGAGSWAVASHLPNLARHEDVELVGVARKGRAQLLRIAERYGFSVASEDYRDVLDAGVDVAIVASPSGMHAEHALAALEAGAHVLCEKPVTIDPESAWMLAREADERGKAFVVAFGWNYKPMVQRAKALLGSEGIGTLEHMTVHMSSATRELLANTGTYPSSSPETAPDSSTWTDPRLSGGGYGQAQLTHALGLAFWLSGARSISGFAQMSAPLNAPVELHDAIVYNYEGGGVGVLSGGSAHLGANNNRHSLEVRAIGSRGQFLIDVEREAAWIFRDGKEVRLPVADGEGIYDCVGPIDAILAAARGDEFINQSPAELGARVVEALDIAYRSMASGHLEHRQRP